ncbi:MAG: TlpA disulfide reductase family protein [Rickettsiaceae bacterium]|nr:TlpA disulfide reductase family protein [Rickettsiaceae bacterium]
MKKRISIIISCLILMFSVSANATKSSIIDLDAYTNTETPFFDDKGNKLFLDQYEGNTVLLVFWATWCGTCVSELASLDNLSKDFRKLPFKVIALSEDYRGIEVVQKHFEEREIRHLEIFHDYSNQLFRAMSVNGIPTAFLINSDGKIRKIFKGRIKWQDDQIRTILLGEVDGNPEVPKNTYKTISLNRQVGRVTSVPIVETKPNNNSEVKTNDKEKQTSEPN